MIEFLSGAELIRPHPQQSKKESTTNFTASKLAELFPKKQQQIQHITWDFSSKRLVFFIRRLTWGGMRG